MRLLPKREQWKRWSLPSRLTAMGTYIGFLSLVIAAVLALVNHFDTSSIDQKLDSIYSLIEERPLRSGGNLLIYQGTDADFVKRYLKRRLAENLRITEVWDAEASSSVELAWDTHWEGVAAGYRAAVEIRTVSDAQAQLPEDEGWQPATLKTNAHVENNGVFSLVDGEPIILEGLSVDKVYDVRFIDANYDSDDPPSPPLRFSLSD